MSEPSYSIRPARPDDLDRLVELMLALQDHLEASTPDLWRMKPEARSHLGDQLAARLTAPSSCFLVAQHEEQGVVGTAFGRIVTNNRYVPTRTGSIDQVFVRADHRRTGLGTRLVAGLCRFFAAEGVADLSLRYAVGNKEAAAFWMGLGFSPRIVTAGVRQEAAQARLSRAW